MTPWGRRFLGTTRGRIVALLRRASRTVNELAEALELTDNAVRAHIATLERDGIVTQVGTRRGSGAVVRKPNYAYDLTPDAAEHLFPKAYAPVLTQVLTVIGERIPVEERTALLREIGHRLAAGHLPGLAGRSHDERLAAALDLLTDLGGVVEAEDAGGGATLVAGRSCPLGAAVGADRPEACVIAESLLTEIVGAPVRERCRRDAASPRCCFFVAAAGGASPSPEEG